MEAEVIYGSPGTGKTYTLTERVKDLKSQYPKEKIQIVSHTKVAAREIARRVQGALANTIHSLAYKYGDVIPDQVASTKEIIEFSQKIGIPLKGVGDDSTASIDVGDEYMSIISYANNWKVNPIDHYKNNPGMAGSMAEFSYFYKSYENWKRTFGLIDFDDMILRCVDPKVEFKVLFIDEAQDLSPLQWGFVDRLIQSGGLDKVIVTGDPDQSLFLWSGSDIDGIAKFSDKYNAKITELKQSYRVPIKAHKQGQSIIKRIKNRYEKEYNPTSNMGKAIFYNSSMAIDWDDYSDRDVLVLYRTHSLRKEIENELTQLSLPYTCLNGKKSLFENTYATAYRLVLKIRNNDNGTISAKEMTLLKSVATPMGLKYLKTGNLKGYALLRPSRSIMFPTDQIPYFQGIHNKLNLAPTIKLSTIHGAKGMEADVVIILNGMTRKVLDGMDTDPDQERRVWYVAVTRTKNELVWVDSIETEGFQL